MADTEPLTLEDIEGRTGHPFREPVVSRLVPTRRHRFRVPRLVLVGVATAGLVALVATVLVVRGGGEDPRVVATPEATEAPSPGVVSGNGIETLDSGPLSPRGDAAVVWTGREVVVWGGDLEASNMGVPGPDQAFADGAAYDPATRRWRTIAPSLLPATSDPPAGVWADGEVVFFRGREAAAWDPERDQWRSLPAPERPVTGAVWTGRELITLPDFAALDPSTREWRSLPVPPVQLSSEVARWAGQELLVVGQSEPAAVPAGDARGMSYDPAADRWRELPPSGVDAQAIDADWNGRELVVVNYDMTAAAYDPAANRWRSLPAVPARFYEWYPRVVSAGAQTAVLMAQSLVVLDDNDHWTPLPYGELPVAFQPVRPQRPIHADGGLVYLFGYAPQTQQNRFAALDLQARLDSFDTIQVGTVSLTVPPGARLTDAVFRRGDPTGALPPPETVTAELATPSGTCSVSSTYVGGFGGLALDAATGGTDRPVTITPADGSPSWEALAGSDPDHTIVRLDESDLIEVTCTEPGQALELARYLTPPRSQ